MRVQDPWIRVQGLGCSDPGHGDPACVEVSRGKHAPERCWLRAWFQVLGFGVRGAGLRVEGGGWRCEGRGLRVEGGGVRIEG